MWSAGTVAGRTAVAVRRTSTTSAAISWPGWGWAALISEPSAPPAARPRTTSRPRSAAHTSAPERDRAPTRTIVAAPNTRARVGARSAAATPAMARPIIAATARVRGSVRGRSTGSATPATNAAKPSTIARNASVTEPITKNTNSIWRKRRSRDAALPPFVSRIAGVPLTARAPCRRHARRTDGPASSRSRRQTARPRELRRRPTGRRRPGCRGGRWCR